MTSLSTQEQIEMEQRKLPHYDVSPDQFRAAAASAGWWYEVVELFLRDGPPKGDRHYQVGGEMLRVKCPVGE